MALVKRNQISRLSAILATGTALCGLAAGCGTDEKEEEEVDTVELVAGCEAASQEACSEFVTIRGPIVELGERGSKMVINVGEGFEAAVASGDSDGNASCRLFTSIFAQDAEQTARLLDTQNLDMALYTVYRPARWEAGETFPVITWGNGTCAQPEGYGALLRYVASQGFIVVAANSRYVGGNDAMIHALDFIIDANDDPNSEFYGRVDVDRVGAMGHSQGAGATATASVDARIKTFILFNGTAPSAPTQPFLTITGERDLGSPTPASLKATVDGTDGGAYLFFNMVPQTGAFDGHLTLMTEPKRVTELTAKWFEYTLNDDQDARSWFVGDDCTLCGRDAEFNYGSNDLK